MRAHLALAQDADEEGQENRDKVGDVHGHLVVIGKVQQGQDALVKEHLQFRVSRFGVRTLSRKTPAGTPPQLGALEHAGTPIRLMVSRIT